jgi:Holliday junction DNA helicase RuvA
LIKVSGVGGKLALALLSGMSADEFVSCVQNNETAQLTRVPGVGKKTAERLIVEMRDRLKDWRHSSGVSRENLQTQEKYQIRDNLKDAISALVSLGFKPPEASRMVGGIDTSDMTSEEIIRRALQSVTS